MSAPTSSAPSPRIAALRQIVESGRAAGLVRRPGDPVVIEKKGTPLATEGALRSQWVEVTPALATTWLDNNFRNRPMKQDVIAAYARDMTAGTWVATHQGLAFNDRDELIDGQHRLRAVIASGRTVRMMVTFGLPSVIKGSEMTTMDAVDRGAQRSVADQLTIQHGLKNGGAIAMVTRSIAALCSSERTRRLTVGQTLEIYRAFQPAVDWMIERRATEHGLKQAGVLAAFAFAMQPCWNGHAWEGADKITAMYERLVDGKNLKPKTALLLLRAFLTSDDAKLLNRGTDRGLAELVLQAIHLELKGRPVAKLEISQEGAEHYRGLQADRVRRVAQLFSLDKAVIA